MKTPFIAAVFRWHAATLCAGGYFVLSTSVFPQGSLTPPGPPAATMKTLDQIDAHIDVKGEKRIDLQNAPASAVTTTDANYHFIITQPGSYYLSANLGVTKTNGIQINAEGVTLDLSGFEISRATGTGGNGIEIPSSSHRTSIRNGSLKGFGSGIRSVLVAGAYARACGFRDLSVSNCTGLGISAGEGAVLEACRAQGNTGSIGISAGMGSSLTNCTVESNTVTFGIFTDNGCSLNNCTAANNTVTWGISVGNGSSLVNCSAYNNHDQSTATSSAGIKTGFGCTISHCAAYNNTSTTPTVTAGVGFHLAGNNAIVGCTASANQGDGIRPSQNTTVRDCTVTSNGAGGISGVDHVSVIDCNVGGNHQAGIAGNDGWTIRGSNISGNCTVAGPRSAAAIVLNNSSLISGCTLHANQTDGIKFNSASTIEHNLVTACTTGDAIHSFGYGNRIDSNEVRDCGGAGFKLDVNSAGNVVIRNSAGNNTAGNYVVGTGNGVGPIINTSTGVAAATNSPFANIQD